MEIRHHQVGVFGTRQALNPSNISNLEPIWPSLLLEKTKFGLPNRGHSGSRNMFRPPFVMFEQFIGRSSGTWGGFRTAAGGFWSKTGRPKENHKNKSHQNIKAEESRVRLRRGHPKSSPGWKREPCWPTAAIGGWASWKIDKNMNEPIRLPLRGRPKGKSGFCMVVHEVTLVTDYRRWQRGRPDVLYYTYNYI